jgi:hypothetical protein
MGRRFLLPSCKSSSNVAINMFLKGNHEYGAGESKYGGLPWKENLLINDNTLKLPKTLKKMITRRVESVNMLKRSRMKSASLV